MAVELGSRAFAQGVINSWERASTELDLAGQGIREVPGWFTALADFDNELEFEAQLLCVDAVARAGHDLEHSGVPALRGIAEQFDEILPDLPGLETLSRADAADEIDLGGEDVDRINSLVFALEELLQSGVLTTKRDRASVAIPDDVLPLPSSKLLLSRHAAVNRILRARVGRLTDNLRGWLRRLTHVYLGVNQLTLLPEFLTKLPNLAHLDLQENPRLSLSGPLPHFPRLEELTLTGCTVDTEEIGQASFPALIDLDLSGCVLPPRLKVSSPNLRTLTVADSKRLADLQLETPALEELDASYTFVDHGAAIRELAELRTLTLANCSLSEVPAVVSPLLWLLNLSGNELEEFDISRIEICSESLRGLDLSRNLLVGLPEEVRLLRALSSLDLTDNDLEALPLGLAELSQLSSIFLDGNDRLPDIFKESAFNGPQDLLDFVRALGSSPDISNQGKALVVGEGAVGKTSLISAITGGDFIANRPTTHGIELSTTENSNGGPSVDRLTFWDFGGQEVYRVTHPFFFSRDAIYVVAWRPREGMEQAGLEFWLEAIRHRVGTQHCAVLLVSTWADEGRGSRLDLELLENTYYPAIVGFVQVDSASGRGIADLKSALFRQLRKLPHYGDPVPTAWAQLRRRLPRVSEGFLLLGEYEALAGSFGLDPSAARSCARLLNTLGDLLYFDETDGLAPVIVTDPEILTRAVSHVLEDEGVQASGGLVSLSRLREIWEGHMEEVRSNPDVVGVLVNLLRRFDVGIEVRLPDTDALLLSDMLPFVRPLDLPWEAGDAPISGERELRLDIRCDTAPIGLVPWLIVRNFRMVVGSPWRNGAVFGRPQHGASAIVEWNPDSSTFVLAARGRYPLDTFIGLKNDVETLLALRWPYLPTQYQVPCPNRFSRRCDGAFELEYVERKLSSGGSVTGECRSCLQEIDLRSLVTGLDASGSKLSMIEDRLDQLMTGQADLRHVLSELALSLRHLREAVVRGMDDTPLLFTLAPRTWTTSTKLNPKTIWSRVFELQLWCEHWDEPHPCGDPYQVRIQRSWYTRAFPYLRHVGTILKLAPLVRTGTEMFFNDATVKDLSEALSFLEAATAEFSVPSAEPTTQGGNSPETSAVGLDARLIRTLLLELESEPRDFRGLEPLVLSGRPTTWLCPTHAAQVRERPTLQGSSGVELSPR
ncbi:MAG: COR domain-containing protein [Ilumatobacter fluminis]|uniref:COR domain-containing protein n=1 Tax=Ilumatobacter fluminis TaxID=467091 RepID=UPI0032F01902